MGRWVLTGLQQFDLMGRISQSLTGRVGPAVRGGVQVGNDLCTRLAAADSPLARGGGQRCCARYGGEASVRREDHLLLSWRDAGAWLGDGSAALGDSLQIHHSMVNMSSCTGGISPAPSTMHSQAFIASEGVGALLEAFVVQEVRRQLGWSRVRATAWHFRTATGREVDLVLERGDGGVVGIEVKASAGVGPADCAGLRALAEAAGERFVRGVVLYEDDRLLPLGGTLLGGAVGDAVGVRRATPHCPSTT